MQIYNMLDINEISMMMEEPSNGPIAITLNSDGTADYYRNHIERFRAAGHNVDDGAAPMIKRWKEVISKAFEERDGIHAEVVVQSDKPGIVVAASRRLATPFVNQRAGRRPVAADGIVDVENIEETHKVWAIYKRIRSMYHPWKTAVLDIGTDDDDAAIDIFNVDRFGEVGTNTADIFGDQDFLRHVATEYPELAEYVQNQENYDHLHAYTRTAYYSHIMYINKKNIIGIRGLHGEMTL